MSFLLPIVLAFTFMASSPFPNKIVQGPVLQGVEVKPDPIDRACLAPCRLDEKGNLICRCGEIKPKS